MLQACSRERAAEKSQPSSAVRRPWRQAAATKFSFVGDPDEAKTIELFRLRLTDGNGEDIGRLDVIRRVGGWSVSRALDAAITEYIWWDMAGREMPVPILGIRLTLNRQLTEIERDVLVSVCVDIGVGLRPYATAMQ